MTKNTELKLICKVADVIERLSERNQDLLLFRYKHNYSDDLIADLMAIPKEEVSQKINHAKLLVAMSLSLKTGQPLREDILKRAVTIVMHRQIDDVLEIEDGLDNYEAKPFEVFMQELEERYEKRTRASSVSPTLPLLWSTSWATRLPRFGMRALLSFDEDSN